MNTRTAIQVAKPPFKMGKATREAYGETLVELGKSHPEIVVIDMDLSKSTMTRLFGKEFPDRFFNIGVMEANAVSMAAGFAASGKVPFVSSFSCFLVCKGYDQMRISVFLPRLNVKFVSSHGGISIGEDGPSQQGIEDVALMCALPGSVVIVPADEAEAREAVRAVFAHSGPTYIRTGRPKFPTIYENGCPFTIGKANLVREGTDITLIGNGLEVAECLKAAEELAKDGIEARVLDMHTVKPLDLEAVAAAAKETGAIVTAEEHLLSGGLGATVAQAVAARHPVPMGFVGIRDTFAESGTPEQLLDKYGLTARHIVAKARRVASRKP